MARGEQYGIVAERRGEVVAVERETAFPLAQPSIVIQQRLLVRGREACRAERREARWTGIWNMMLGKIGSCVESTYMSVHVFIIAWTIP